jgi:eukaryotic-like serine/threonine-protein kinase
MTESPSPTSLVVSHYRIVEKIGQGGMGIVYRAHDDRLRRDVALKFLPPDMVADKSARDVLIHEARAASALNHPNICTVYDIGQCDGRDYIVMEYVKGLPLAAQIREGAMADETVIRYGEQIADALAHAHEHGVIHRDLKASNIIITPEGRAKVLDFGLAKRRTVKGADDQTTNTFETEETPGAGTMHYTAPEILRGEPADARSDIWSLGVVLYEMAAGRRPFHGGTAYELSSDILYDPPDALPPKTPLGLGSVIERCLAKSPADRYQQANEVRAALGALRSSGSLPTPQPTAKGISGGGLTRERRPWVFLAGIVGLVLVVTAGWVFIGKPGKTGASANEPVHSLAVLPLENMSGDPSEEFYAEGMTEELTTQLAQISALRVISRTSVMQYKASKKSLPEIAKELRVDAIVEGSVMRSGDRVRITAQLIQAATDKHLWAKSYDGDARDVLGLQRNVAQAIANEVKVQLTPQEQERLSSSKAVNPAAHEAYLRGDYLNKGTGAQQLKAKEYFEEAIRIDPSYAAAYAGLANYYWSTPNLGPREAMPRARENALKALELDPDLAQAHATVAAIHFYADWDFTAAENEFKRALELNPSDAESHRIYSFFSAALGRVQEALVQSGKAQELDPLSSSTQVTAGWVFYWARQYDKAVEQCQKALEFDLDSAGAYDCLGSSYLAQGMYEQAIGASQRAVEISESDSARLVELGRAYALAGRKSEAQKVLEQLRRQASTKYVPPYLFAVIYTAQGRHDEAFASLEKAYTDRDRYMVWLNIDSEMDSLRPDPRFESLVRRIGFPQFAK